MRNLKISNYLSYIFSMMEILFYGGVPYGFGFLQYIFEKEGVFWKELCYDENNPEHVANCKVQESGLVCESNLTSTPCLRSEAEFNSIYTYFLLTSSITPLILSEILNKYGLFIFRLLSATFTTAGLVTLCFYESNPYLLWVSWQLLGVSAVSPIYSNIRELCPLFPAIKSLSLGLINGFFDASGGMYLVFKLIYDSSPSVSVPTMITVYTAGSSLLWIKSFFFSPRYFITGDKTNSVFKESFIGSVCKKHVDINPGKEDENNQKEEPPTLMEYKKSLLSMNFLTFLLYSIFLTIRTNSFPIWCLPWLKWTFREYPEERRDQLVSQNMDIYGIMYFASILLCPIPGMVTKWIQKCSSRKDSSEEEDEKKGEYYSLLVFLGFAAVACTALSAQMCMTGSQPNATSAVIEFSMIRTIFYITRGVYVFQFFPESHFGFLYAIISVVVGTLQFIIDPLFKLIQNNGEVDFIPVSAAMAVACGLCLLQPFYNWCIRDAYITTNRRTKKEEEEITSM